MKIKFPVSEELLKDTELAREALDRLIEFELTATPEEKRQRSEAIQLAHIKRMDAIKPDTPFTPQQVQAIWEMYNECDGLDYDWLDKHTKES